MGQKINVPVLWDANGNFKNGETYAVNVQSLISGIVAKPVGPTIPGYPVGETTNTLQIKDPNFGTLFLDLTLEEYLALVGATGASPDGTFKIFWTGDDQVPAGDVIVSSELEGIEILSINKAGVTIYPPTYTHTGDTLDLTAAGGLTAGEDMEILAKRV